MRTASAFAARRFPNTMGIAWVVDEGERTCKLDVDRFRLEVPFHGRYVDVRCTAATRAEVQHGIDLVRVAAQCGLGFLVQRNPSTGAQDLLLYVRVHACGCSDQYLEIVFLEMLRCCRDLSADTCGVTACQ